ncbi:TonB-dependent receptor domain-containing protein [Chitinophaga qingshengii]|uniref:TonB-dependent receptor n=1 Tax=Chitinophaga qingshengii TaxID=1569794 RepID=A0ABR7TL78_9BACT|nr:TonB-dependent receptor [Chitinophaga qingshengii]MBC9931253.1 TonB-dependent receptor [Chitinophaga qingshengii]
MSCHVMILLTFFVSLSPLLVAAQAYKSLTDKVQLQMGKTTAAVVVKALQQQTPYTFIYDPEYLQQCTIPEARFPGRPLGEVLTYIDQHTPLDIELAGDKVIALRKGSVPVPAAQTDGRIRGKVVDNKNEPLPGVTVAAQSGQGTITAVDGSYELVLTPGVYSLSFSFISYETKKVTEINVKEKSIVPLNVVLKSGGSHLKEVTVTGNYRKASVEGLYALQKNNAAITDGISAEQIARTPDKNIGEVLKRVSGLATMDNKYVVVRGLSERYNQAMLNGQVMPSTELNRKNFSFDIIPSNIVENVTVIKTITPDRSAEFGGGLVEVNTLDIPTENFLNVSVGGSYNDKTTGKDFYSLPLSGSEYWGNTAKHRYLFGTLDWKDRFDIADHYTKEGKNAALFNNNWTITKFKAPVSPNFQASFGHVLRGDAGRQWGLVAAVSYRNTLSTQDIILGREGFAETEGKEDLKGKLFDGQRHSFVTNLGGMLGVGYRTEKSRIGFQSLYLRTLDQQLIFGVGDGNFGANTFGLFDLGMQTSLWQNQLRGEHAIGAKGIRLKWSGSYLKLDRQKPDNHTLLAQYLPIEGTERNDITIGPYNSSFAEGALRSWSRALENNYNWEAAVSVPFKFNAGKVGFDNTFKGGYAGWNKDRLFFVLNTLSRTDASENYYPLGKRIVPENGLQVGISQFGDNFKRRSAALHALFAMLDNRIAEKWRLVWGVRAEYYNLNKINNNLDSTFAKLNTVPGKEYDYSDLLSREPNWRFFPSVNLTYSLTSSMNLRLAYSESIIRPDLRELSVFREYDFELGGDYTASLLRSTTIKHVDFRYEWYPGPGEVLSASLFYKDLSYPMEIYRRDLNNNYELLNSKSAKNYGIELEMRKSLSFINAPVLRNITVYGNFTYLDATVKPMLLNIGLMDQDHPQKVVVRETVAPEEKRPQMGASNFMFNAGIYYDSKPVSLSLAYNSVANRVFLPNATYRMSLMERPLQSLDAQIAFRFLKQHAEFKVNAGNLLNSYAVIYLNQFTEEQNDAYSKGEAPSKKAMRYDAGQDAVNFKSSPGRTYSATFTYKF